jgi:branched-chain amino acid aminotransferase
MTCLSDLSQDRGFLLGDGLFETVRLYRGRPFRLRDHLARLERSASRIRVSVPQGLLDRVEGGLREANCAGDGSLRITLTRGPGPGLLPPDPPMAPTLRIEVRPFEATHGTLPDGSGQHGSGVGYESGLEARILGRVDETAITAGMKGIGYLERITALLLAREAGAQEALLRNGTGRVVAGSASNLFLVRDGVLQTPRVEDGVLPGITRQVVLELAGELGLGVELRAPEEEELLGADEIFLTSSLRELTPVVRVDGTTVGAGRPGPIFQTVRRAFRDLVVRELELEDPWRDAPGPRVER